MAKQTPEGAVKADVKKRLAAWGVLPFIEAADTDKPVRGTYWMPVQGMYSVHGPHDFVGCWSGIFFTIETKAPNNPEDATEPQRAFQTAVIKSKGISLIGARSADAVDALALMIEQRLEELKCQQRETA